MAGQPNPTDLATSPAPEQPEVPQVQEQQTQGPQAQVATPPSTPPGPSPGEHIWLDNNHIAVSRYRWVLTPESRDRANLSNTAGQSWEWKLVWSIYNRDEIEQLQSVHKEMMEMGRKKEKQELKVGRELPRAKDMAKRDEEALRAWGQRERAEESWQRSDPWGANA